MQYLYHVTYKTLILCNICITYVLHTILTTRYSLLERLVTFYYADRMYSHFTLRHLVSESHNPQHPLQVRHSLLRPLVLL